MNIYKTKAGEYINLNMVQYIDSLDEKNVEIWFEKTDKIILYNEEAQAFLEYLDLHSGCVYAGSA